ncbi:outer membrane beta-barrel protein [Paraflavitalea pollutisoli]|uniref:outer membrane beta-barrel protein n=1 Tax=Paraflavitalea pollutisoli TaxID=3034143 RepID=UPI0023EDBB18|nr:outer membrane beta-barrel protein [Paraflavitalea sp. H1-2-19X]
MKTGILFLAVLLLSIQQTMAQLPMELTPPPTTKDKPGPYRINAYVGYVFDDKISHYGDPTSYYTGTIQGGLQWGISGEYLLEDYLGISLSYSRQDTKADMIAYENTERQVNLDMGISYVLVGLNGYWPIRHFPVVPYGGAGIGFAFIGIDNPANGWRDSGSKLAWGVRGGTNITLAHRFAIKLQGHLLSAVYASGGALFFGDTPNGGLSAYTTIFQFGLGGGLVVTF